MRYSLIAVATLFGLLISFAEAGDIRGAVVDANDNPVPRATVVLCGRDTGIPLDKETFKPFTDKGFASKGIAVVATDTQGAFAFEGVPDGKYKLVSQSWVGKPSVLDIGEVNSRQIVLHGIARRVVVPSQRATNIRIRPLGNAVVTIDEDFPNSDGYLLISTKPLSVDPILGFVSWQGPFLKNLIGANRMPEGITKIHGLPEGKICLSVFANDNNGGLGAAFVEAKAGRTVRAEYIPIVCSWSNGRHDPPEELAETFAEIKKIYTEQNRYLLPFLNGLLEKKGITVKIDEKARSPIKAYYPYLKEVVVLPSGKQVRFADVLACGQYVALQNAMKLRRKR
jgi:hypothetical protein